jgi:uncharacterized protein (TIGR03437 family)
MRRRIIALILFAGSVLSAADFENGQAARAVIGQPSFSARESGIVARALSIAQGNLYVADASGSVLTFDLSRIGSATTAGCPVCLVVPQSTTQQSVIEGVAAAASNGRNIVIADSKSQRVLIWRDLSSVHEPDVVLSGFVNPVSVALDTQRLFVGDAGSHHVFVWNTVPSSDDQPPDVTLGVSDSINPIGADTIDTPSALASDGANLLVADAAAHRVLVFSPADSAMPQLVNAATLTPGSFAPGTLVSLDNGAAASTVFLNGSPIKVTDANGGELQVQIPYDLNDAAAGSLWVRTEQENGSATLSRPVALRLVPSSPGIFAFGSKEPRTGLLVHESVRAGAPLSPEDPARPGELLTVWATGLGAIEPEPNLDGAFDTLLPVRAAINGNPVEVLSASLPAEATGVYEVRLRLPAQLAPSPSLVLFQNDSRSNAVTFPVQANHQ